MGNESRILACLVCLVILLIGDSPVIAQSLQLYVATTGNDTAEGSSEQPLKTIGRAKELVREHLKSRKQSGEITVTIRGTHYLAEPLVFTPDDCANDGSAVIYRSNKDAPATISGGQRITGFKQMGHHWQAEIPTARGGQLSFRELFVGGTRRQRARTPNTGFFRVVKAGPDNRTSFEFKAGDLRRWHKLSHAEVLFLHDWSITRIGVRDIDEAKHTISFTGPIGRSPPYFAISNFEPNPRYALENVAEALDSPGEWYVDRDTGVLSYWPQEGETLETTEVIAPRLNALIMVRGEEAKNRPVRGLRFEGLTIDRCGQLYHGSVGIWIGLARATEVSSNEVKNLPYTGVSVGWSWTPAPTVCEGNVISGNHIHHVMQLLSEGAGIYTLGRQPGTTLKSNVIHDVPVNLGRAESNGIFMDEGSSEMRVENNIIYNITKSPIRFHKAGKNTLRFNLLVSKPGVRPFRYNNTKENLMVMEGNQTITAEKWQPPANVAQ